MTGQQGTFNKLIIVLKETVQSKLPVIEIEPVSSSKAMIGVCVKFIVCSLPHTTFLENLPSWAILVSGMSDSMTNNSQPTLKYQNDAKVDGR